MLQLDPDSPPPQASSQPVVKAPAAQSMRKEDLPDVEPADASAPRIDFSSNHARWFDRVGQG
jgi:hypothetical protein